MKVVKRVGVRRLLLLAPFALLVIMIVAVSAPISTGFGAYSPSAPPPPPAPGFFAAPAPGTGSFNGYLTVYDVDAILANNANKGHVHIIDVRSQFEYLADVCPMQIALGLPLYTVTNIGHPVWNWPDGTHEESYSDPYWIGFHWNGVPGASTANIRMQENPNYDDYLQALLDDGSIKKDDTLIFLCETGYRASFAAKEAVLKLGLTNAYVLHGGMLAWEDDWFDQNGIFQPDVLLGQDPALDPSHNDCDATQTPGYSDCKPDNQPGPLARPKSTVNTAPWAYDTNRLTSDGKSVYWDGTEPHVGVKAEWLPGDFKLSLSKDSSNDPDATKDGVYWASPQDYNGVTINGTSYRILSVDLKLTNNPPDPPSSLNYPSACGGAPPPAGSCEQVHQAAQGTAYNAAIVAAPATNGVLAGNVPAGIGNIAPNASGATTVKFDVPDGVSFFRSNVYAYATDVPDTSIYNDGLHNYVYSAVPGTSTDISWYGAYTYPTPPPAP